MKIQHLVRPWTQVGKEHGVCWRHTVLIVAALLPQLSVARSDGYDCLVEPAQTVELGTPVSGLLQSVLVKRGDRVSKGQLLAALDSRAEEASAELARLKAQQTGPARLAQAKADFSRRKFERHRNLAAEKLMSDQDSDDAESEFRQAQAELQLAEENRQIAKVELQQQTSLLELRRIRSPFNGVVVEQMLYPGEVVEPGAGQKAILKLAQLDPLRVHVILPKEVFGRIKLGDRAEVTPEIPAKSRYSATVKSVDRLINAASGSFVVFLELPNPKLDVPSGVKCKAQFSGLAP